MKKTVDENGNPIEVNDNKDYYKTETFSTMEEEYNNDNHERITIETVVTKRWYKWEPTTNAERGITDGETTKNTEEKKEVVKEMKTFVDFMKDWKEINAMPKSEFRDKAFEALNAECKEALQVGLPALEVVVIKDEAIEKSVGLKDSQEDNKQEEQKKTLKPI